MASSNPQTIPVVINLLWNIAPRRVLDIGAGLGKYGVLFREYLELRHRDGGRQQTADSFLWRDRRVRIDCVEGFSDYIGELHKVVYDNIYNKDIVEFIEEEWDYDVIFAGDVLEHIEKAVAVEKLLPKLVERANMGVLISVPFHVEKQGPLFGNALDVHRSSWCPHDFRAAAPFVHVGRKGSQLISFLTREKRFYRIAQNGNVFWRKLRAIHRAIIDSW